MVNNDIKGYFTFFDQIRENSFEAIALLKKSDIKNLLLTGDNERVAKKVSEELKMDGFIANVLPHEKLEKVKELQQKGEFVAMTGDGVNDAPALAQSDVGIAVGSGTDVAAETADIILVNSNPMDIANLILFGKATYNKMIQNLWWAAGYNIIAIPLAAGVLYKWNIMLEPCSRRCAYEFKYYCCCYKCTTIKTKLAMIEKIISWSTHNRFFVWIGIVMIVVGGVWSVMTTPVDAIPDLSENQVIVYTEWMGRNPQIMEDQITYPLVSNLQGIPNVKSIRAASMFGMSFIFVIFDEDAEIYWARTRVLERLNFAQQALPPGVTPSLGPDGTGVGHVFWYTLQGDGYDLGELRAVQDWYVKFALQNVEGVSEVASFGGFQKQYQVSINPHKLVYFNVSAMDVSNALKANNRDVGGSIYEMNRMGYMIRGLGYIKDIKDIEEIAVGAYKSIPVRLKDVADVQMSSDIRLGIVDENGEGEVVGGVVVARYGENAKEVIDNVKERLSDVEKGLPPGVKIKIAYDRSNLIEAAITTLKEALIEEIIVVSLIVLLFLFHVRSALVAIVTIPLSVLIGFMLIKFFGISLNIMSLGGIALAIGDLVDAGIVMTENAYKKLVNAVLKTDE